MADLTRGFIVAGPASGVGKTTIALALMAALRKRGLTVQPFKCGPDFIDGGHHARVCQRPSRNLDGWMLSAESNRECFLSAADGADICVVEGVMGLFDGVDGNSEAGSTAQIAKWLGLPVILVVDASSMARSAAALVHGFRTFDPDLNLAGVIFNRVAGDGHYRMLRDALSSKTSANPFGYFRRDDRIQIPERYLGLFTAGEALLPDAALTLLGELAETNVDIDGLLECCPTIPIPARSVRAMRHDRSTRIGVARDKAFSFYYEDNLDALRRAGADIVEFSPLKDQRLPEALDSLYFGGGYPELFAGQLSRNLRLLDSVRRFAEAGLPIYAECGGLMYLSKEIIARDETAFPMVGVLPIRVQMTDRLVNFGYTEASFTANCLLGCRGTKVRGHSFHCSRIIDDVPLEHVYRTRNSMTGREDREGFRIKNVLASYIHLHFLSSPGTAETFVRNVEIEALSKSPIAVAKDLGSRLLEPLDHVKDAQ